MNARIKAQRERMAATKRELDELLKTVSDRDGKFTGEEEEKVKKMTTDLRAMGEVLGHLEEEDKRDAQLAQPINAPPPVAGDQPGGGENRADAPAGDPWRTIEPRMGQRDLAEFGRFVTAIRYNRQGDAMKLAQAVAGSEEEKRILSMSVGAEGGLLVPDKWRQDILMMQPESEIVLPRCTFIPPGGGDGADATEHFPALVQGATGALGGLTFTWIAEAELKPESDYDLEDVKLEPHEYACHVIITDKLLRNSQVAGTFLRMMLNLGIVQYRDIAFLTGNGVGQPLGVFNVANPAAVNVLRAGAGLIDFADVVAMLAAFPAESWNSGVWVASQSGLPQIVTIADAAGNSIYIGGDAAKNIPPTLLGIPIRWTGRTPTLGNRGDLGLIDFRYYLVKQGSGPEIAASEHVYFTRNKTVVKAFGNYDGSPWMTAPLTLDDGATQVSPFVILQ